LIFLDAIEKRQGEIAAAIGAQPESVKAAIDVMSGAIVKAIQDSAERIVASRTKTTAPESNRPVIDAIGLVNSSYVAGINKLVSEIKAHADRIIYSNQEIISALNSLQRPRKWKFKIDRNYQTKIIQDVTVEAE